MLGDENPTDGVEMEHAADDVLSTRVNVKTHVEDDSSTTLTGLQAEAPAYKKRGFLGSFGYLVWEQRHRVPLYAMVMSSACICGDRFHFGSNY